MLRDLTADVLIVRYDAARLELAGMIARSERAVVAAGALTYWDKVASADESLAVPGLDVLAADTLDLPVVSGLIQEIVRASFRDYGNHYTANPLLDRSAALAGYEDWALRSLASDPRDVLVLTADGDPIGVATLEAGAAQGHFEVLLAGLVPAAQGRGLYGTLLRGCEHAAVARGARRLVISTQVHNVRVQRAWAREGLRPFAALETVHLIGRHLLQGPSGPTL